MVFDEHGEVFDAGIHRGALGDGPAFQDAFDLESEVVVEVGSGVFLDDELELGAGRLAAEGLGGFAGGSFLFV
jgi:hypothetical protein